jgi:hypothetical protein
MITTRQGLIISDFPDLTISPGMMEHLRRHSLIVINPNQAELQNLAVRFQLPEPVIGKIVIESRPAGVEVAWNACRLSAFIVGNGASARPVPGEGIELSTAPKAGASASQVLGGEVCSPDMNNKNLHPTGIYQLQIERMPALSTIKLGFLTSNDTTDSYFQLPIDSSTYCGDGTYQFVFNGSTETFPIFVPLSFNPVSRAIASLATSDKRVKCPRTLSN